MSESTKVNSIVLVKTTARLIVWLCIRRWNRQNAAENKILRVETSEIATDWKKKNKQKHSLVHYATARFFESCWINYILKVIVWIKKLMSQDVFKMYSVSRVEIFRIKGEKSRFSSPLEPECSLSKGKIRKKPMTYIKGKVKFIFWNQLSPPIVIIFAHHRHIQWTRRRIIKATQLSELLSKAY